MKKAMVIIIAIALASMAQAATLTWTSALGLLDTQSGMGDTNTFPGASIARAGTDLYLIYNAGGSFGGVEYDLNFGGGQLQYAGTDTAISFFNAYTTTAGDQASGVFSVTAPGVGLTTFSPNAATWEAMNNYNFTILAITDTNGGNYSSGAWYGLYTGNLAGFSTATGNDSLGGIDAGALDASGAGLLSVVAIPEPATFLLFAMGGFGAWLIRRRKMAEIQD